MNATMFGDCLEIDSLKCFPWLPIKLTAGHNHPQRAGLLVELLPVLYLLSAMEVLCLLFLPLSRECVRVAGSGTKQRRSWPAARRQHGNLLASSGRSPLQVDAELPGPLHVAPLHLEQEIIGGPETHVPHLVPGGGGRVMARAIPNRGGGGAYLSLQMFCKMFSWQ